MIRAAIPSIHLQQKLCLTVLRPPTLLFEHLTNPPQLTLDTHSYHPSTSESLPRPHTYHSLTILQPQDLLLKHLDARQVLNLTILQPQNLFFKHLDPRFVVTNGTGKRLMFGDLLLDGHDNDGNNVVVEQRLLAALLVGGDERWDQLLDLLSDETEAGGRGNLG
jgi:hypothetical protein